MKRTKKQKKIQCKISEEWNTPTGKKQIRKRNKPHRKKLNGTTTQGNDKKETEIDTQIDTDLEGPTHMQNDKWFVLGK